LRTTDAESSKGPRATSIKAQGEAGEPPSVLDQLAPLAFTADGLQGITQHVVQFPMGSGTGGQSNVTLPAHNQQRELIILQLVRHDADKCPSGGIERLRFQLIQTFQALRQDNPRIESGALGCTYPHLAPIADHQQNLAVELLRGSRDDGLQSGAIQVL